MKRTCQLEKDLMMVYVGTLGFVLYVLQTI